MEAPQFVLAVDGGGSKTEAALYTASGQRIGAGRAGPCNLYRDAEAGARSVQEAWRQCCAAAALDVAHTAGRTVLSAALAGVNAAPGRAQFRAAVKFAQVCLSSDGYAGVLGAFEGGPGVLVAIGTGTVACRLDRSGRFEQRGGWGFPAGDRGSGAWIGLQLVGAWLEYRDGARPDEPLWRTPERRIGTERGAILEWLRRATPADYAALAPAVIESGSALAQSILDEACQHVVRLAGTLGADGPLALTGGLADALAPRLVIPCTVKPGVVLRGAWLIGAGHAAPEL